MKKVLNNKGFTVIELMVVVATIGVLAAVILTSLSAARAKGRDARRIRDIEEINKAVQLYILQNGDAPDISSSEFYDYNIDWDNLKTALSPYIKSLAKDPCGQSCPKADPNNFFAYGYEGPTVVNQLKIDSPGNFFPYTYIIFANRLEKTLSQFGFGLFSF